jgi:hypothetical protein
MTRPRKFGSASVRVPRSTAGAQWMAESRDGAAAELIVRLADARQSLPPGDRVGDGGFAGAAEETD